MYTLTRVSRNRKTGPLPVSTSHRATCPASCALKGNGCYAEYGPLALHWRNLDEGGLTWDEFLDQVKALPRHQMWRHNQAGDLRGTGDRIDTEALEQLTVANRRKKGFTYTHYPMNVTENREAVEKATANGFTINVSTDSVSEGIKVVQSGLRTPVVSVLPTDAPNCQVVDGVKVVACPGEKSEKVDCARCGLCQLPERDYIVGFRAHGTGKKKVEIIILKIHPDVSKTTSPTRVTIVRTVP